MDWLKLKLDLIGDSSQANRPAPPKLSIPALSSTVNKVLEKTQKEDFSLEEIQKIIEVDAGITFELLKFINSASFGLRNKVSTIKQAISLLGIKKTRLFLISMTTGKMMQSTKSPLLLAKLFSLNALEKGLFARALARKLKLDEDLSFAAAMLQDFLLPYLTVELLDKYTRFLQMMKLPGIELSSLEEETFGWNHAYALALMLDSWKFPADIICCVALHHQINDVLANSNWKKSAIYPVALSSMIPDLTREDFIHQDFLSTLIEQDFQLDLKEVGESIIPGMEELGVNLEGYEYFVQKVT